MIKPTVGRVVWFYGEHGTHRLSGQPLAAIISYVHSDRLVNLMVISPEGEPAGIRSIQLHQDGDEFAKIAPYCEWMPYQKGQAAKTEALEAKVAAASDAHHPPPVDPL